MAEPHPTEEVAKQILGSISERPDQGKKRDNYPYVKLLDDGEWKISAGKHVNDGYVSFDEKVIHVPTDESASSERTRFHEMGHVLFTPPEVSPGTRAAELDVPAAFLQTFEDARITRKVITANDDLLRVMQDGQGKIDVKQSRRNLKALEQIGGLTREVQAALAAAYITTEDLGEHTRVRQLCQTAGIPTKAIDEITESVLHPDATFEDSERAACRLKKLFEQPELGMQPPPMGAPQPGDGDDEVEAKVELDNKAVDRLAGYLQDLDPQDEKPAFKIVGGEGETDGVKKGAESFGGRVWGRTHLSGGGMGHVTPGIMYVRRPLLTERVVRKMNRPRVKRHDLAGGEIRSLHRLITDEKILLRKSPTRSRRKVGTVLIDTSGSMSVSVNEIDAVLRDAPQVTIALYGSAGEEDVRKEMELFPGEDFKARVGHLSVVAHKGKRIARYEMPRHFGGGNVVDTEALRWLASQPGPRVWVCDGDVTGYQDQMGDNITAECKKIALRCKAAQVESMYEYFEAVGVDPGDIYGPDDNVEDDEDEVEF